MQEILQDASLSIFRVQTAFLPPVVVGANARILLVDPVIASD